MKRWDAFAALCGHLRAGLLGGAPPDPAADVDWKLLVEASSHHYVTPSLAWCLRGRSDLPPEIRAYFDAALTLNGRRNARLAEALVRVVTALNAIDIEPVLLKGAARLVDGVYPAATLRFLGDIDILIPADRSTDAASALMRIGFDAASDTKWDAAHHHLPVLRESETGACVELHTGLALSPGDAIVPPAWFVTNALPFQLRGARVRLPAATQIVAHNIVHDQLNHANYRWGKLELRQLLDLAMVRKRHENTIDWSGLDRRFGSIGEGPVLATYLEFAERLLGQAAPRDLRHAPRPRAMADFRRDIDWPALRTLGYLRAPIDYVVARRGDPVHILKRLISPNTWWAAFELVRAAIARAKW